MTRTPERRSDNERGWHEAFAELRSALQGPPTRRTWRHVCALLERFDATTCAEVAVPYVLGHTQHWPAARCAAPTRWLASALRGEAVPALGAARALSILDVHSPGAAEREDWWEWAADHDPGLHADAPALHMRQPAALERLFGHRELAHTTIVRLVGVGLSTASARRLASWSGAARLEALDVTRHDMDRHGVSLLCQAETFPALRRLHLGRLYHGSPERHSVLTTLRDAAALERLEALGIATTWIDDAPLIELFERASALRALDLSDTAFADTMTFGELGVASLAESSPPETLEHLTLCDDEIEDDALEILVEEVSWLEQLRGLDLSSNALSEYGLEVLAGSGLLATLEEVRLAACLEDAGDEPWRGWCALAMGGRLDQLRTLDASRWGTPAYELSAARVEHARTTAHELLRWLELCQPVALERLNLSRGQLAFDASMASLLAHQLAACALRWLDLSENALDAQALTTLCTAPRREPLEYLGLRSVVRHDADLGAILDAQAAQPTRHLDLRGNRLRDAHAFRIATCPHLTALHVLDLRANLFTQLGITALRRSPMLQSCEVRLDAAVEIMGYL